MGYTGTATVLNDPQTDASFRAFGLMISTKLGQCGLVQTSDTGQINWTTVAHPTGASQVMGYEIWRFADALQATNPVFLKIEYGCGANTSFCALYITASQSTNGAGTLTGSPTARFNVIGYTPATSAVASYFCGDVGRFAMTLWPNSSQGNNLTMFFSVERTKDSAGVDTAEGILMCARCGAVACGWTQQAMLSTGPPTAAESSVGALGPVGSSASGGGQIGIFPILYTKGEFFNPGLGCLGYFVSDITALVPTVFTIYGATHTFLPMGNTMFLGVQRATGNTCGILMRWE